jgi:hypothetical protein
VVVVVDTKLQTHVTPEMFGEGLAIAVKAMKGKIQEFPRELRGLADRMPV